MTQRNKGINFQTRAISVQKSGFFPNRTPRLNDLIEPDEPALTASALCTEGDIAITTEGGVVIETENNPPALDPVLAIGDLFAWYESTMGVTLSGPDITLWEDSSGNGRDLDWFNTNGTIEFTGSDYRFNDRPSIRTIESTFSSSVDDDFPLELTGAGNLAMTICSVQRGGQGQVFDRSIRLNWTGGTNSLEIGRGGFARPGLYAGNYIIPTTSSSGITGIYIGTREAAGTARLYWQGVLQGSIGGTVTATADWKLVFGKRDIGTGGDTNTRFAEVAIFNKVLTQEERQSLYNHWSAKYDIPLSGSD